MRELESADHEHPLKDNKLQNQIGNEIQDIPKMDDLSKEFDSVAIDWKALRNTHECSCSLSFDHVSKKVN